MGRTAAKIVLAIWLLLPSVGSLLHAKTWRIGGNLGIKAAIAAAQAHDTLVVPKGIYKEQNIIIDKPLSLVGEKEAVLDGEGKYEILTIKTDSVSVQGLTIRNSAISSIEEYAGIKLYNCRHIRIFNNRLENTFFGIYLYYCHQIRIHDNQVLAQQTEEQQSGNGIHCWKSDSLLIIHNQIQGHRDGIYFEFVTASLIWRNTSTDNLRYGLHFMFSNNDTYIGNVFRRNGAGVSVMYSKQVRMYNNFFEENWGDAAHGILMKDLSEGEVVGNRFVRNTNAIYMEGTSRMQVEKNSFEQNGWAFRIQASCMDVRVIHNNFIGNSFDIGTNGDVMLNHFAENYWDKYEGYDLDRNGEGDIPYRPVSLFAMIVETNPPVIMLYRSLMITLLDRAEKVMPSIIPENLIDEKPLMKKLSL